MTDAELIAAACAQAGVSEDEAQAGLVATLEALGGRLAGGLVDDLAAALPEQAAGALRRGRTPQPEAGSATDLAARVSAATGAGDTEAANLVQAVLRAVADGAGRDVVERMRDQLPSDLARLLQCTDEGDTGAVHTGA